MFKKILPALIVGIILAGGVSAANVILGNRFTEIVGNSVRIYSAFIDSASSTGANGNVLSSTGTSTKWIPLAGGGDMLRSTYDPASVNEQLVGLNAVQNVFNKSFSTTTFLNFNTTPGTTPTSPASTYWDSANGTLATVVNGGSTLQHGEETWYYVKNTSGSQINDGQVVMYNGTSGNSGNLNVTIGKVTSTTQPTLFMGIATQNITNGGFGMITEFGKINGVETDGALCGETWNDGDLLWVSTTTNGCLTKYEPQAPNPAILMAAVISSHTSNGTLFVRPTYPEKMTDMSDVDGTPLVSTGQFPVWNNTRGVFDFDYNINNYITSTSVHTLTNKTLNSLTNYIDADALHEKIFNNSGGSLATGTPVHGVVWNLANSAIEVDTARADTATRMPAICITEETIPNGGVGSCRTAGILSGMDTSVFSDGTEVYVAPTGGLTSTAPTASGQFVQMIGQIKRQNVTAGVMDVFGVGQMHATDQTLATLNVTGSSTFSGSTTILNLLNAPFGIGFVSDCALTSVGSGQVSAPTSTATFWTDSTRTYLRNMTVASTTITLTDGVTNYIVGDYNTNSFVALTDPTQIDYIRYIPYAESYRNGTNVHIQCSELYAKEETAKQHARQLATDRYAIESGLNAITINTGATTTIAGGVMWAGSERFTILTSSTSTRTFSNYHVGGAWTNSSALNRPLDLTWYDNGVSTTTMTDGYYGITYVYRGIESPDHAYTLFGNAEYPTLSAAQAAPYVSSVPSLISSHAALIGRIIYLKGTTTGAVIQLKADTNFSGATSLPAHSALSGLDFGSSGHTGFQASLATSSGLNISANTLTVMPNYFIPLTASGTEWGGKLSTTTAAATYPTFTYASSTFVTYAYGSSTYAKQASTTNWDTAYSWGNHAGLYPTFSYASSTYLNSVDNTILNVSKLSTSTNGYVLQSFGNNAQWVATSTLGISGGASTFLSLTDTPSTYSGSGDLCVKVNTGATGLVFGSCSAGGSQTPWSSNINGAGYDLDNVASLSIGTTTHDSSSLYLQGTSTYDLLRVVSSSSVAAMVIDQNGFVGINMGTTTLDDALMVSAHGTGDILDLYNNIKDSVFKVLASGFVRMQPSSGIFWSDTDQATSSKDYLGIISNGSSISLVTPAFPNNASSVNQYGNLYEPFVLPCTGATNFSASYSDDVTRILTYQTAAAGSFTLHNGSLTAASTGANGVYDASGVLQSVAATGLSSATHVPKGAITYGGFHYIFMSSTTSNIIKRATSSWTTQITSPSSWSTTTISGTQLNSGMLGLVGVASNSIWMASSTTVLIPYIISTSTNILTAGTPLTISGAAMSLLNTRVNSRGVYAGFTAGPMTRKFNFSGVQDLSYGSVSQSQPSATGPSFFVMPNSVYLVTGTAQCSKVYGW